VICPDSSAALKRCNYRGDGSSLWRAKARRRRAQTSATWRVIQGFVTPGTTVRSPGESSAACLNTLITAEAAVSTFYWACWRSVAGGGCKTASRSSECRATVAWEVLQVSGSKRSSRRNVCLCFPRLGSRRDCSGHGSKTGAWSEQAPCTSIEF
jgi:hypothetical protein